MVFFVKNWLQNRALVTTITERAREFLLHKCAICNNCSGDEEAVVAANENNTINNNNNNIYYCCTCACKLCANCNTSASFHGKLLPLSSASSSSSDHTSSSIGHSVLSLHEFLYSSMHVNQLYKCSSHNNQYYLDFICTSCEQLLCSHCLLFSSMYIIVVYLIINNIFKY